VFAECITSLNFVLIISFSRNLQHHKLDISNKPEVYGGAIIICNHVTKRQFFEQKHFALPGYAATFIKKIRAGMLLFLFEHDERKLYGVFEATSDGALNILPDSCASLCKFRPAQVSMLFAFGFFSWFYQSTGPFSLAGSIMHCFL
jgi:hypothetical protein